MVLGATKKTRMEEFMVKAFCRYSSLADISDDIDVMAYRDFVHPFDYDFNLKCNSEYLVLGIVERKGTLWLYITSLSDGFDVEIVPAVLFYFNRSSIHSGMGVELNYTHQSGLEITPISFSSINCWFEKYIDEDEKAVEIVKSEIQRLRLLVSDRQA